MIFSTGFRSDFFVFDLVRQGFDTWSDSGGQDVLIMSEASADPYRSLINTGSAIVVQQYDAELTIPHDFSNLPSVEYLEWRQIADQPGQVPNVTAFLRIVTDLDAITGTDIAVIATSADEIIQAPEHDSLQPGFSEIHAGGGTDTITLSSTMSFRAFGGDGNDVIRATGAVDTFLSGDKGRDKLFGAQGNDTIYGGRGKDIVQGRAGDDFLFGDLSGFPPREGNDDRIKGGKGDDFISGAAGNDVLTGGSGRDTFDFAVYHAGIDRITDFDAANDKIILNTDTRQAGFSMRIEDGDTLLRFGGFTFVILEDVELSRSLLDIEFH